MKPELAMRVWNLLATHADDQMFTLQQVCAAAVQGAGVDGAGITVMSDATHRELVHGTDEIAASLEDLQLTLQQGPCFDALAGDPVLAADLSAAEYGRRWPLFTPAAIEAGAAAVFALPLRTGAARFGAIDLYRIRPRPLDASQLSLALAMTDVAVAIILDRRDDSRPEREGVDASVPRWWASVMTGDQALVHQAAGMVSQQLHVSVDVAMARLRGHAFASGQQLTAVARDVVQRLLRLDGDDVA